jgi:hypothetical protein
MGSWHTYRLTVHPGERDPEAVAAELRGALPDALLAAAYDTFELDDIVHGDGPAVWVADGLVHFATGRNWRITTFDWSPTLVPALPVPARWACAVWQQEVEYNGGVELFGWVDGRFVPVDEQQGLFGAGGRDALRVVEREWDVTGSVERDVPKRFRADSDDPVADLNPASVPGFEPLDRDALGDSGDALATLTEEDCGAETRRRAAERLYALVTERDAPVGLDPRLFAALDDDATKWAAGATVRELSVTTDALADALAADDAERRRAAARFCLLRADEPSRDDDTVFPAAVLASGLDDDDRTVRRTAARAFERSVVSELADPPTAVFDALADAATDDDPDVRAAATLALVRSAFDHEAGDFAVVADALAAAAFDPSETVRDRVDGYFDTRRDDIAHRLPDDLLGAVLVALSRAAAGSNTDPLDFVDHLSTYPAYHLPWVVDPVLADLVELGWDADSALARDIVTTYVEGADDSYNDSHDYRGRLGGAFATAGVDPGRPDVPGFPTELLVEPPDEAPVDGEETDEDAEGADGDAGAGDVEPEKTAKTRTRTPERSDDTQDSDDSRDDTDESAGLLGWLPFR